MRKNQQSSSEVASYLSVVEDSTGKLVRYLLPHKVPDRFMADIIALCFDFGAVAAFEEIFKTDLLMEVKHYGVCGKNTNYKVECIHHEVEDWRVAKVCAKSQLIYDWVD